MWPRLARLHSVNTCDVTPYTFQAFKPDYLQFGPVGSFYLRIEYGLETAIQYMKIYAAFCSIPLDMYGTEHGLPMMSLYNFYQAFVYLSAVT